MNTPDDLKISKTDEWVKVENDSALVGITDYAQDQLSDIVYVEFLKESGDPIERGEVIATIESVKAAADVNCPISGKVIEVNENLLESPEILNEDPYKNGWIYNIEMSKITELDELFNSNEYDDYCKSRH
jgi:glycine cleavage system H protein